jgi:spoIIIJ-associated protein
VENNSEGKMTGKRTTLEIIAPSVEEAVEKGLAELGISKDAVEIEILDEGSRGFLKLGSRDARIRLTVKASEDASQPRVKRQPAAPRKDKPEPTISEPTEPQELDEQLIMAKTTVEDLLDRMKIYATVSTRYGEPENPGDDRPVVVDIRGNDLSILIGRKAETLNALQYVTNLIIGRHLEKWVPLHIDVEGYRARREMALKNLAERMAEQARSSGRRQVLEPMPANERRLIHIALREDLTVITESIGEEPNRKVTICPRKTEEAANMQPEGSNLKI